jgi:nucleotidyltransferase/DNA polymerase involved in DNA repair
LDTRKAGLQHVDKAAIDRRIEEYTRNGAFYRNEEAKARRRATRDAVLVGKKAAYERAVGARGSDGAAARVGSISQASVTAAQVAAVQTCVAECMAELRRVLAAAAPSSRSLATASASAASAADADIAQKLAQLKSHSAKSHVPSPLSATTAPAAALTSSTALAQQQQVLGAAGLSARRALSFYVHVDLDAFYAAVEELDFPHLRGVPLGIGGVNMLGTSNYAAREYGVRAGMPGYIAKLLCPHLVIRPNRFGRYREIARIVRHVAALADPRFKSYGWDELRLDLHELVRRPVAGPTGRLAPPATDRALFLSRFTALEAAARSESPQPATSAASTAPVDSNAPQPPLEMTATCARVPPATAMWNPKTRETAHLDLTIDPASVDWTPLDDPVAAVSALVLAVRRAIFRATNGLTASAGIAPTPALSKVASNVNKPDGQYDLWGAMARTRGHTSRPPEIFSVVGSPSDASLTQASVDLLSNNPTLNDNTLSQLSAPAVPSQRSAETNLPPVRVDPMAGSPFPVRPVPFDALESLAYLVNPTLPPLSIAPAAWHEMQRRTVALTLTPWEIFVFTQRRVLMRQIPFVGKVTAQMLQALGAESAADFFRQREPLCYALPRKSFMSLFAAACGLGHCMFDADSDEEEGGGGDGEGGDVSGIRLGARRSVGCERTFSQLADPVAARAVMLRVFDGAAKRFLTEALLMGRRMRERLGAPTAVVVGGTDPVYMLTLTSVIVRAKRRNFTVATPSRAVHIRLNIAELVRDADDVLSQAEPDQDDAGAGRADGAATDVAAEEHRDDYDDEYSDGGAAASGSDEEENEASDTARRLVAGADGGRTWRAILTPLWEAFGAVCSSLGFPPHFQHPTQTRLHAALDVKTESPVDLAPTAGHRHPDSAQQPEQHQPDHFSLFRLLGCRFAHVVHKFADASAAATGAAMVNINVRLPAVGAAARAPDQPTLEAAFARGAARRRGRVEDVVACVRVVAPGAVRTAGQETQKSARTRRAATANSAPEVISDADVIEID